VLERDFAALERLAVHVTLEYAPLRRLFASPPRGLVDVALHSPGDGDRLVDALLKWPLLSQLRALRMWNAHLTAKGVALITRERFGHLELLDLSDATWDPALVARLAGACRDVRTIPRRVTAGTAR
jgi:hypothetical protein